MEKTFPMVGKNGPVFPMIGNFFSNGWKTFFPWEVRLPVAPHSPRRGWKPHPRKPSNACAEGSAPLPEVRHPAAPPRKGRERLAGGVRSWMLHVQGRCPLFPIHSYGRHPFYRKKKSRKRNRAYAKSTNDNECAQHLEHGQPLAAALFREGTPNQARHEHYRQKQKQSGPDDPMGNPCMCQRQVVSSHRFRRQYHAPNQVAGWQDKGNDNQPLGK